MNTRKNPHVIDRNHPVRFLIETGALGNRITTSDLKMLDREDMSSDANLARFKPAVDTANKTVVEVHMTEGHAAARRKADELAGSIAARMNDEEAALTSSIMPDDPTADLTAFANKIFEN